MDHAAMIEKDAIISSIKRIRIFILQTQISKIPIILNGSHDAILIEPVRIGRGMKLLWHDNTKQDGEDPVPNAASLRFIKCEEAISQVPSDHKEDELRKTRVLFMKLGLLRSGSRKFFDHSPAFWTELSWPLFAVHKVS
jgi:hypothetical protein